MIKHLFVEQDDVGLSPLVVRVALLTLFSLHFLAEPVIALHFLQVIRHRPVAFQTEAALGSLVERHVATGTLFLILGVPTEEFAGHDETFQFTCHRRCCSHENYHAS